MNRSTRLVLSSLFCSTLFLFPGSGYALDNNDSFKVADELSQAFEHAAKVITPSVVSISTVTKSKFSRRTKGGADPFEQFREFFGDDFADRFGGGGGSGPQDGPAQQSMGTGVIVDRDGRILTNCHVVEGADEITVRLHNGDEVKAKLVGTDPRTDLAVIQIKSKNLEPASLGQSSQLRIGEWVVAAGNPFGLDNSITAGIVSAKGRALQGKGQYEDFIQTDAAINPGNSGGPLVNLRGEVIGINTAIFTRSGGYMGIGFAIPIDMAKSVLQSLISNGKVIRGWLGVAIQPVTKQAADNFGFSGTDGALVGGVEPEGPAERAGVQQGDIITTLDGQKIKSVNELRNLIASLPPSKSIELGIFRNGEANTIPVKIGELPAEGQSAAEEEKSEAASELGLLVQPLPPELESRRGKKKGGVLVTMVKPGGLADTAGLRTRDIIISINGTKVDSPTQFSAAVDKANRKKGLRLVVESEGMEHFVFINFEN